MVTDITPVLPMTALSRTAARLTLAANVVFLVSFVALHLIKPEFDPSWRMVSEYAIGQNGWIMELAFLCMSLSCVTLFLAIHSQIGTLGGKIGLGFLLATALGLAAAAIFPIDPITAAPNASTTHGMLHGLASIIGVPGLSIAAILISRSLARNPAWSEARRSLFWAANLAWISLLLMILTLAIMLPLAGKFGPNVWIGWPNRIVMIAYSGWLITVAWRALQLSTQRSG